MSQEMETLASDVQEDEPPSSVLFRVRRGLRQGIRGMQVSSREMGVESWKALKLILVLLLLCGVVYPLLLFVAGQLAFPAQANGSLITNIHGQVVGSTLLGQQFTETAYFHGRPSAVDYNAANSGGSNIGPTNPQLIDGNGSEVTVKPGEPAPQGGTPVAGKAHTYYVPGSYLGVKTYAEQFRQENGLAANTPLPADIITASGSGLDPEISVEAALLQVNRVVMARRALGGTNASINPDKVRALIAQYTQKRDLGVLGEPGVNVLELNLALDTMYGTPSTK